MLDINFKHFFLDHMILGFYCSHWNEDSVWAITWHWCSHAKTLAGQEIPWHRTYRMMRRGEAGQGAPYYT